MREPKRPLSAQLTPEAYKAWEDFAYQHRVTVVALLEAIGLLLAKKRSALGEDVVSLARQITEERRSRRRS